MTSISLRLSRHLSTTATATATLSSISISKAKLKLQNEHNPDKALQIYSSISSHYTSPLFSRYAQELTVKRLAKAGRFNDIETLIESHKKDPRITQEPFVCTSIRCYGKCGMIDHALKLYDQMHELGTPRSSISFNALLAATNNCGLFDDVPQLFDDMPKNHGFNPDKFSYGILIKAYCEKGDPEMGLKILKEMEKKGVEVTRVSFTTVMDALYKIGNIVEAEKVWDEMVRKGCKLDVAAWNARIKHCGNNLEEVLGLIKKMRVTGLKPDTTTFTYVLTCYCKGGMMDEALNIFDSMNASGIRPKAAIFRTLINHLSEVEDYASGYDVFLMSVYRRKIPDFETLKVLAKGMVENGMRKDAKGLIRTVKKKFPPNMLNAWKKVEIELGLATDESIARSDVHASQEAAM